MPRREGAGRPKLDDPKANNAMVVLTEDKTPVKWLWHTSDLIVVKEGNDV